MLTNAISPTPARPAVRADQKDLRGTHAGFTTSLSREHGYEAVRVEGVMPAGLRGTLVRNGPGLYELFGRPYVHPFEGDGALLSVRFDGRGAQCAHRVIASEGLRAERRAGRPLFGTNASQRHRTWNGVRRRFKNAANTNVLFHDGRLLALFEMGLPTEIDLESLDTVRTTDLGIIDETFSAHPHRVAAHRTTYNFGQRIGLRTWLDVYALPDAGGAKRLATLAMERPVMLHDFIATERHVVFFVSPVRLDRWRALFAIGDYGDYFDYRPEDGTEVIVIPIADPERTVRFRADPFWVWHFANAYERGDEIIVDYIHYDDFGSLDEIRQPGVPVTQGQLTRRVLSPTRQSLGAPTPLSSLRCDFPTIDPGRTGARTDGIWIASDDARTAVARVDPERADTRAWVLPEGHRPSEPVVAPCPSGGAGWVLSLVYDAKRHESYVAVLDATRPEDGPVAKAWLGHHVPPTFHGAFVPH